MTEGIDYNQEVLVRCGYCGNLLSFFPHRVLYLGPCHCGNDNWGRPNKWKDHNFGDFDFIGELKPNLIELYQASHQKWIEEVISKGGP